MNRRDFLSFKSVREPEPTFDLECHALYMRWMDASRPAAEPVESAGFDPMAGEPAAQHDGPSTDDIIHRLEESLDKVRRLRVLDGEWLQTSGLGERVTPLLDAFRAKGGTIVFDSTEAY
jgi:hypothetical protein